MMTVDKLKEPMATAEAKEGELPLASEGVKRYRHMGRWGEVLIEVYDDGRCYVNGDLVERPESPS